jgi:hypothetical protein
MTQIRTAVLGETSYVSRDGGAREDSTAGTGWKRGIMALNSTPSVEFSQGTTGQTDLGQFVPERWGVFPIALGVESQFASRPGLLQWRLDVGSRRLVDALSLSIL